MRVHYGVGILTWVPIDGSSVLLALLLRPHGSEGHCFGVQRLSRSRKHIYTWRLEHRTYLTMLSQDPPGHTQLIFNKPAS